MPACLKMCNVQHNASENSILSLNKGRRHKYVFYDYNHHLYQPVPRHISYRHHLSPQTISISRRLDTCRVQHNTQHPYFTQGRRSPSLPFSPPPTSLFFVRPSLFIHQNRRPRPCHSFAFGACYYHRIDTLHTNRTLPIIFSDSSCSSSSLPRLQLKSKYCVHS